MQSDLPHTEDPIVRAGGTASYAMRYWMERVSDTYLPSSWVFINKEEDFPNQSDTTIFLEDGKFYIRGAPFSTAKNFSVGKNVHMTSFTSSSANMLTYTGTGVMFTGVDFDSFEHTEDAISCPNADVYDFSSTSAASGNFVMKSVTVRSEDPSSGTCQKFGTFDNLQLLEIDNSSAILDVDGNVSRGVTDGIEVSGTTNILNISRFALLTYDSGFVGLNFTGASFVSAFEVSNFINISLALGAVGFKGDRLSSNIAAGIIATVRDCEFIGLITPLDGITSRDIRFIYSNSAPVSDSTVAARLKVESNTTATTMAAALTPTPINVLWSDGEVEERMCFGDKLTFDSATDTCTTEDGAIDVSGGTPFNHGFSNGDTLTLLEGGTLPAGLSESTEYYVGNVTATTFQLFPDDTLTTAVDFTDNGTPINYYCHDQGSSNSSWCIYLAESATDIRVDGWVSIQKTGGGSVGVRAVIMETDTSYTVTRRQNGASVDASNTILSSSQVADIKRVSPGEGFIVYVENITGTTNNIISDALVSYSKA